MWPDRLTLFPRLRHTATNTLTALGLFLLIFLGAKAAEQIRSDTAVRGRPRAQQVANSTLAGGSPVVQLPSHAMMAVLPVPQAADISKPPEWKEGPKTKKNQSITAVIKEEHIAAPFKAPAELKRSDVRFAREAE